MSTEIGSDSAEDLVFAGKRREELNMKIRTIIKNNWSIVIVVAFLVALIGYVVYFGEDIYIAVHDNLDSNIAWYKMLKDNHLFWAHGVTVPFLGGIDRNYLPSELQVYAWLYMIFPVFYAYVAGGVLKVVIAIVGSIYLGKVTLGQKFPEHKNIVLLCGFLYSLLPTFPASAFGFASLPLLLGLLYSLYHRRNSKLIIALFFYPLLSDFSLFGIFICGYLLIFILIDAIRNRKVHWLMVAGLVAVSLGYIVTEYRLFYVMFFSGEETIRTEMVTKTYSFVEMCYQIVKVFAVGQYHAGSLHTYIVMPICFVYFLVINIGYLRQKRFLCILTDVYNWIIGWIFCNAVMYGLNYYEPFVNLVKAIMPVLDGFSFARTIWFNPFLWYLLFAMTLCRIADQGHHCFVYVLYALAMAVICVVPSMYNHIQQNLSNRINSLGGKTVSDLTYGEFYSESLFEEILEDIDYDGEYSVAFGMHPAVLEYNGIFTLDGYRSFYPLSYKKEFCNLIEPVLDSDDIYVDYGDTYRCYFDTSGIRAYIFSSDVTFKPTRDIVEEAEMLVDADVFEDMGGRYVFSRVSISNASDLNLELVGKYQNEESPYTIYVYTLISSDGGECTYD